MAVRTEFFAFFHLEEDERRASVPDQPTVIVFRPTGTRFHDQVALEVVSDAADLLVAMGLLIKGSLIDDPGSSGNARDIARSFIANIFAEAPSHEQLNELLRDLRHRPPPGTSHQLLTAAQHGPEELIATLLAAANRAQEVSVFMGGSSGPPPELPPVMSRGFAVFSGQREQFSRAFGPTRITITNVPGSSGRTVVIEAIGSGQR
jgi:hypothetical protein